MKDLTVIKREALFIKRASLGRDLHSLLKDRYTLNFYEEKACKDCEFVHEKHCDICDTCAAFKGSYKLAHDVLINDKKYLRLPIGDIKAIRATLLNRGHEVKWVSKNPHRPIKPFKFTGTLKDHQEESVKVLIKKKRGILEAPPRSGKTVVGAALTAKLGLKTLIIASQRDWLVGFHETFVGSKTQIPLTDIDPKRIGFARKLSDFSDFDVCLCTVQMFYSSKGEAILRHVRDMFSVVIFDEVHTSAAEKYSTVASRINVEYSFGLSGTPDRKDGKMIVADKLIGPVIHKVVVERMKPVVRIVRTKYSKTYRGKPNWAQMVGSLERDPGRMKLVADFVLKDVEAGHLVLIPLAHVASITKLIKIINDKAGYTLAHPFYGTLKKEVRDETIQKARQYKIKVIVGNTRMLSTGINIPRASALYEVTMSSNAPNCIQRVSRILTIWDDKPTALLRIFIDNLAVRRSCLANEWFRVIGPTFKPLISDKDKIALESYFKEKGSQAYSSPMEL